MPSERIASRRIPLAVSLGRQIRHRDQRGGWMVSAVLHLALVGLVVWSGREIADASRRPGEGPGLGGGGGGGGGNRIFAVFAIPAAAGLPVPPPPPVVLPNELAVAIPEVKVPEEEQRPPSAAELLQQAAQAAGPGQGEGRGTGTGPGSGSGAGGGIGSGFGPGVGSDSGGGGGRVFPPQPQGIILPPSGAPSNLRGVRLTVRFDISERGEVLDVTVEPPIRNRRYREEFMDRMRRYVFTPAYTLDGRAVRAVFPVEITL